MREIENMDRMGPRSSVRGDSSHDAPPGVVRRHRGDVPESPITGRSLRRRRPALDGGRPLAPPGQRGFLRLNLPTFLLNSAPPVLMETHTVYLPAGTSVVSTPLSPGVLKYPQS